MMHESPEGGRNWRRPICILGVIAIVGSGTTWFTQYNEAHPSVPNSVVADPSIDIIAATTTPDVSSVPSATKAPTASETPRPTRAQPGKKHDHNNKSASYGEDPGQVMDVYPSAQGAGSPSLILVHGGGWSRGNKEQLSEKARKLAEQGFKVYNVDYRLKSDGKTPLYELQREDMQSIINFVAQDAGGVDADIYMMGGSAGGHLVSLSSQIANDAAPGMIDKVVSLSGPMDFMTIPADTARAQLGAISNMLGCKLLECSQQTRQEASPISNIHPDSCPEFFIVNARTELVPLSQAEAMSAALKQAGCQVQTEIVDGNGHAFRNYTAPVETDVLSFLRP